MKQIYYVIRTLLRGRGSNIIKVISLGLGLTMSILLFSRVAFEQSYDTFYKDYDNLYQIFSIFQLMVNSLSLKSKTVAPWQVPYWKTSRKKWKQPPVSPIFSVVRCIMAVFVSMMRSCWLTHFFPNYGY